MDELERQAELIVEQLRFLENPISYKTRLEMLEDLIAAAVNSAAAAVDKDSEEEMSKMTGGLNIPGLG